MQISSKGVLKDVTTKGTEVFSNLDLLKLQIPNYAFILLREEPYIFLKNILLLNLFKEYFLTYLKNISLLKYSLTYLKNISLLKYFLTKSTYLREDIITCLKRNIITY
ncbi:hypothetical protein BT63DRAFT_416841 [Microthyrium microscopicum]|uniref:Uncharacterized protein n=1 Tax=Microthyrium microscopicum TaxID=703497 RepID=A0A6A6U0Y4_9PEZI|nr:hypothetical protein BT63DRAFT_416841 [Microthyrium microscopicum]